jgi:hypothetical protein
MNHGTRNIVIGDSVEIEEVMAEFLAYVLKIDSDKAKKELPLDYIQLEHKCRILKDMKAISKRQYLMLQIFVFIRNRFAHNIRVELLSDCISANSDQLKHLKKFYPGIIENGNYESYLTELYEILSHHIKLFDMIGYYEFGESND